MSNNKFKRLLLLISLIFKVLTDEENGINKFGSIFSKEQFKYSSSFSKNYSNDLSAVMQIFKTKNSNGGIISNDEIDSIIANGTQGLRDFVKDLNYKVSSTSLKDYLTGTKKSQITSMAESQSISNTIKLIEEYNNGLKNAKMSHDDFISSVTDGNSALGDYLLGVKEGEASLGGYSISLAKASAKTLVLKTVTMALNAGLTMLVSAAISYGIKKFKEYHKTQEELIEIGEEARQNIEQTKKDYESASELVDKASKSYADLAKGVDLVTGKNVSLSNEEYQEFLNISNQLADTFPTLSRVYDENGNAIVQLDGDAAHITSTLQQLLAVQKQLSNQDIIDALPSVYKEVKSKNDQYVENINELKRQRNNITSAYNEVTSTNIVDNLVFDSSSGKKQIDLIKNNNEEFDAVLKAYSNIIEKYNITVSEANPIFDANDRVIGESLIVDGFENISAKDLEQLKKEIGLFTNELANDYASSINELNTKIASANNQNKANWSNLSSSLFAWLYTDDSFKIQSDSTQAMIQKLINSFDFSQLDFKDWDDLKKFFKDDVISLFENDETSGNITKYIDLVTRLNGNEITVGEYAKNVDQITEFINGISKDENDPIVKQLKIMFGIDEDGFVSQYNDIINKIGNETDNSFTAIEKGGSAGKFKEWLSGLSTGELEIVSRLSINTESADWDLKEWKNKIKDEKDIESVVKLDISTEKENLETVKNAISESVSTGGLSKDNKTAIEKLYSETKGYDASKLFIDSSNGIKLNSDALRELQAEYEKSKKNEYSNTLNKLIKQYKEAKVALLGLTKGTEEYDKKVEDINGIKDKIESTKLLIAQYDGLTSKYNKWIEAQESANQGANYDNVVSSLENIQDLYKKNLVGTDDFRSYVDLISGKDLSTASVKEVVAAYKELNEVINGTSYKPLDFLTEDSSGLEKFLKTLHSANSEWASVDNKGNWTLDFNVDEVAEKLGLSADFVELMVDKLNEYGFEIDITPDPKGLAEKSLSDIKTSAEDAYDSLKELNKISDGTEFNFKSTDKNDLKKQIEDAETLLKKFKNEDGTVDLSIEGAYEAQTILAALIRQKQEVSKPEIMKVSIDESTENDTEKSILKIRDLYTALNDLEVQKSIGLDTADAEKKVQDLTNEVSQIDDTTLATLGLNTEDVKADLESISNTDLKVGAELDSDATAHLQDAIHKIDADMIVAVGIDEKKVANYIASAGKTVTVDADTSAVDTAFKNINNTKLDGKIVTIDADTSQAYKSFNNINNTKLDNKTIIVTVIEKRKTKPSNKNKKDGAAEKDGTAFANGSGYWGARDSGVALGGEEGMELRVRNGRFETIGRDSAEFFSYQKGDIIFNAEQTKQILKYGKITSGQKRGRSYVDGNAFAYGSVSGTGSFSNGGSTNNSSNKSSSKSSSTSNKDVGASLDKFNKYIEKLFDWIEIRLNRLQNKTDKYISSAERKIDNGNYAGAGKQYKNVLSSIGKQIGANQSGESKYRQQANTILNQAILNRLIDSNTAKSVKEKVANGTLNISDYSEKMRTVIKDYQDWYEKSLSCANNVNELLGQYSEYAEALYNLPIEKATKKIEKLSDSLSLFDKRIENSSSTIAKAFWIKKALGSERISFSKYQNAAELTDKNLRHSKHKINESSDNALAGLSTKSKNYVIRRVNNNQSIDYENIKNLSVAGKKAIINYNKALSANINAITELNNAEADYFSNVSKYAENLYNLPIDKATEKINTLSDSIDLLNKRIENTNSTAIKKSLLNDSINVERGKLNAALGAVKSTKNNLKNARSKIDQKRDKALIGLSDIDKTDIINKVKKGKEIDLDYIDTTKLSNAGREAIIKYNKALKASAKAVNDANVSQQDYISNVKSIAEDIANLPLDKAQKKIDKINEKKELSESSLEIKQTAKEKNSEINKQTNLSKSELNARNQALEEAKSSVNDLFRSKEIKNALLSNSNKGKKIGEKLSTKGIDKGTKEYEAIIKYNSAIDAQASAQIMATKAANEHTKTLQENTKLKYENIKSEREQNQSRYESNISVLESKRSKRDALGYSQVSEGAKNELLDEIRERKNLRNSKIGELNDIQNFYNKNYKNLSEVDRTEILNTIDSLKAQINDESVNIANLNDSVKEIETKKLEISLNKLTAVASALNAQINIKQAKGIKLTAQDYAELINNSSKQVDNYKAQNSLLKEQQVGLDENSKKWQDLQRQIESNNEAIDQEILKQVEWNNSIANIPFDTLDNEISVISSQSDVYGSVIDLNKAKGKDSSAFDYINQLIANQKEIDKVTEKLKNAQKALNLSLMSPEGVYGGKTSEEWTQYVNSLIANINELETTNESIKDSLRDDVYWRNFERAHDSAERFSTVLSGISSLLSDDMSFDSDGNLTDFGISKVSTLTDQIKIARKEVENYSNDIANLNNLYKLGIYTELEYKEKLSELQNGLLNSASSVKSYIDEIVSMYKKLAQTELDALFKVIDARNEALNKKKSYYDYDKTIRDKTKDIQSLESQISALEGVQTAEARAKRARLNEELKNKKDEFEDTLMTHEFELSQDALSNLKETLQESFDKKFENLSSDLNGISDILKTANEMIDSKTSDINNNIATLLGFLGVNPKDISNVEGRYANGTKSVPRDMTALTNENGDEIIVTKEGLITPLNKGDGVIPAQLTEKLYSLAQNELSGNTRFNVGKNNLSALNIKEVVQPIVNQYYDSLINIEGSADAATVEDLKKLAKDKNLLEASYQYTSGKIISGSIRAGLRRRI